MINLLPDARKDDIRAARANVILVRYTVMIVVSVAFLCGALYVSYTLLQQTMASNQEIIASNDVKADVYSETKAEVDALSGQLSEAKAQLDQEVRYSQILVSLGQITPPGTLLGTVKFTSESFTGTPVEIIAYAKSAEEASLLQSQFQSSSLFTQVNLQGTDASGGIDGYPTKVTLTVTMNGASR